MKLKTLYKISKKINGTQNKFTVYRNHCRFCFRYMIAPNTARAVQSMQEDQHIRDLFDLRPKMYDQPTHPYVCLNWNKATRLKNLSAHLNFMSKQLGEKSKHAYSEQGYKLFSIQGNNGEEYDVRLCSGEWREGSLGLSITDKALQSIYFTTFCVTESGDLFIGCIQGARGSIEDRSDIIKSLTKAQHGMRPKALIVELTIMFARHFGLSNAYCVTNKGHVYNASDYRSKRQRKKMMFDYDAFCSEMSGIKQSPYQFKLPIESIRRDLDDLNRTKRKMYRKRYEMLDLYEEKSGNHLRRDLYPNDQTLSDINRHFRKITSKLFEVVNLCDQSVLFRHSRRWLMIYTTTETIPGREIETVLGIVNGNIVQSKHVGRDIMAGLKGIVGGELKGYTEMLTEAREIAIERLVQDAAKLNADAVVGIRFTTSAITDGASELMVFGTAVKLKA